MNFISIKAENFLSFKELNYNFINSPILVMGENLTDDSQESNGSGKSALQASIEYCLFGTTSRKVIDNKLIRFGEKDSNLELQIYCPFRNKILIIQRDLSLKGSSKLRIYEENSPLRDDFYNDENKNEVSFATVLDGNKYIINWIDISKEDLQNFYIINKERYKSFFSSSNKEKIEMINRFSNAKLIEGIDKDVQNDVDNLMKKLTVYKEQKQFFLGTAKGLFNEVKSERNRDIEKEIKEQKEAILLEIEEKEKEIKENESRKSLSKNEIVTLKNKIELLSKKVDKVNSIKNNIEGEDVSEDLQIIASLEEKINKKLSLKSQKKSSLRGNIKEIEKELDDIERNLLGVVSKDIVCPNCKHEFVHEFIIGNDDIDINEEREYKEKLTELKSKTKKSIDKIDSDIKTIEDQESEIQEDKNYIKRKENFATKWNKKYLNILNYFQKEIHSIDDKIESEQSKIKRYDNNILTIDNYINNKEKEIEDLKNSKIDKERIKNLQIKLKEEGKKLRMLHKDINKIKDEIFETSQWIFNFKKFNMFLANQPLLTIQSNCNKFLEDVHSDLRIKWEGYKVKANGDIKEEITPYILRGSEIRDFWSFSGGERARLEYTTILALQKMINSTHKYGGLNFLSTDEIGEGTDAQGLSDIMKSLSSLNKTILLTTHVVNRNVGDKILLIRKENGISKIVN
jgi:exonuclease SbcC